MSESPAQPPGPPPAKSAKHVFQDYGVASVALLFWVAWCISDGWFRPDYEHIGFSRLMAYIFTPVLVFCAIMAISAGRTLWRQNKQNPQTPPPAGS